LDGVDLEVAPGELLALVGPSGSGKTTLLRLLAGLDEPTTGTISIGGKALAGVPPHRRNVALVFQNLALYAHLTVADNLRFGLTRNSGEPNNSIDDRVQSTAERLGIGHLLGRLPGELSGGEQQRVALGRAIVRRPAVLLLDEPLSSLDGPMRRSLRRELKALQRSLGVPTIYVTHDQAEALSLGDRIAVLDQGKLRQAGTRDEVYHQPANRFVAEFFGPQGMNLIEREWKDADGSSRIALCGFRPEDVHIDERGDLAGTVESVETLGDSTYLHVRLESKSNAVIVHVANELPTNVGASIRLRLNPERVHWFDMQSGERLIEP
jgi:ABC-type sugar transport system ATPase subunit